MLRCQHLGEGGQPRTRRVAITPHHISFTTHLIGDKGNTEDADHRDDVQGDDAHNNFRQILDLVLFQFHVVDNRLDLQRGKRARTIFVVLWWGYDTAIKVSVHQTWQSRLGCLVDLRTFIMISSSFPGFASGALPSCTEKLRCSDPRESRRELPCAGKCGSTETASFFWFDGAGTDGISSNSSQPPLVCAGISPGHLNRENLRH